MSIIKGILDVGAVVILPIVMLILCLIFRIPFGKSLKAGLMIGIGFSGLSLVIGFLMTSCLLYTSPSPRDLSTSRMPSSA